MHNLAPAYIWLIVGALLVAAEVVAPGFFLVWVGAAAVATGFSTLLIGWDAPAQFIVFAFMVVAFVLAAKKWLPYHAGENPEPLLNQRAARLVGETVIVTEAITAASGRVKVGDGAWNARGCDAAIGAQVKITGADGITLIVENT